MGKLLKLKHTLYVYDITQNEIAAVIGVSSQFLSACIKGKKKLPGKYKKIIWHYIERYSYEHVRLKDVF